MTHGTSPSPQQPTPEPLTPLEESLAALVYIDDQLDGITNSDTQPEPTQ